MEMDHGQLGRVHDREVQYGRTVIGPHRDDLILYVDGHHLQRYASEGQERAAAISLKLAEAAIIKDQTGKSPVLVLDEASGELDSTRRKLMFDLLEGQIFYASTQYPSHVPIENKNCAYFSVQGGRIEATTPH
jgi:DNA replication and repair protein RecF